MGESFPEREIEEAVAFGSFDNLKNLERRGFFRQGGLTLRTPRIPRASRCAAPRSAASRTISPRRRWPSWRSWCAAACRRVWATRRPPRRRASRYSPHGRPAAVGTGRRGRSILCRGHCATADDARTRLAAARRQAGRQRPSRGGSRSAGLALRAQDAALAGTLRDPETALSRHPGSRRPQPFRATRTALAGPDPDHRPTSVHGCPLGQGAVRRTKSHRAVRQAFGPGRQFRSGRGGRGGAAARHGQRSADPAAADARARGSYHRGGGAVAARALPRCPGR